MTAAVIPSGLWLPEGPKLRLPRFDPWRIFRPLKLDGQFSPRQTLHLVDVDPGVHSRGKRSTFSLTYPSSSSSALDTGATTHTFSGVDIGAVPTLAADQRIIAVAFRGTGGNPVSVTVGGISATKVVPAAGGGNSGIWTAVVNTGTTATVEIVFSGSGNCAMSAFRMINPGGVYSTVDPAANHASGVLDLSTNTIAGGGFIAACGTTNSGTTTWSGATEAYEVDASTTDYFISAYTATASTESPRSVIATNTDTTPDAFSGLAVAWAGGA